MTDFEIMNLILIRLQHVHKEDISSALMLRFAEAVENQQKREEENARLHKELGRSRRDFHTMRRKYGTKNGEMTEQLDQVLKHNRELTEEVTLLQNLLRETDAD